MTSPPPHPDNEIDTNVDVEITKCLDLDNPVSFFLFAGAGSGKTRSLVSALQALRDKYGYQLARDARRVAVITYTNAACDEIKHRLDFDPLVEVSTIHSFIWALVRGYNADIRAWLKVNLAREIAEIEEAQRKGRAGKAADERARSIASKSKRLESLDSISKFVYSPTGDNRARDSLNHTEVIAIGSAFLQEKPALQGILINRFPFLLIDESQDTNKHLIDALFFVQHHYPKKFALGLFGDMMQRIYADGKVGLATMIPATWAKPTKTMNHRCPKRIVRLINKIRSTEDNHVQMPRTDQFEGAARCFILPQQTPDKQKAELQVAGRMAEITGDQGWSANADFKTLTLEHHMAARRMGFLAVFEPLYKVDRLRTGLLDGSLPALAFFTVNILPLLDALKRGDDFAVAALVRRQSPLLDKAALRDAGDKQPGRIEMAGKAVQELWTLCNGKDPNLLDVLQRVATDKLFEAPEALKPFVAPSEQPAITSSELPGDADDRDDIAAAWAAFLNAPISQIEAFSQYISGTSKFDTHQGVKGLEFPRVMVVMDDEEARGFMFSYEKLFGAKPKTDTDKKNESSGAETSLDRTRRLFYVTCSRAEKSLALVAYSANPDAVKKTLTEQGWFDASEVEMLQP
jgi:DNA helicase-2/ATP-dependent DNA helicase PcrA